MCYSKNDGGQRCHTHAALAFTGALEKFEETGGRAVVLGNAQIGSGVFRQNVTDRFSDLASTPQGREDIIMMKIESGHSFIKHVRPARAQMLDTLAKVAEESGMSFNAYADLAIVDGEHQEERNRKMNEIAKYERRSRPWKRAKHIAAALLSLKKHLARALRDAHLDMSDPARGSQLNVLYQKHPMTAVLLPLWVVTDTLAKYHEHLEITRKANPVADRMRAQVAADDAEHQRYRDMDLEAALRHHAQKREYDRANA